MLKLQTVTEFKDFDRQLKNSKGSYNYFISTLDQFVTDDIQQTVNKILNTYFSEKLIASCTVHSVHESCKWKMTLRDTKFCDCLFAIIRQYYRKSKNKPPSKGDLYIILRSYLHNSGDLTAERALAEGACSGFIGGVLPDQTFGTSIVTSRDRKLAFHEPRPCDICSRVYRDAATLRQHTLTMHSAGTHFCGCGVYFYTKYELLVHKKQAHF